MRVVVEALVDSSSRVKMMIGDRVLALSEYDVQIFEQFVPEDHFLRKALTVVSWDQFEEHLASYYHADIGRPSEWPLLMLKLEYLRYQYGLSDGQVIERAKTDIGFRFFLPCVNCRIG